MPNNDLKNAPILFQGNKISICGLPRHTSGDDAVWEVVLHPGAVAVIPVMDDGRIVMIRNHRPIVAEELWEIPAGLLEAGEEPKATAARELEEETGYRAENLTFLTRFYSSPGFSNEELHVFVAKGLHHVGQNLDADEQITVHMLSVEDVLRLIISGEIRDCKTLASLLLYTKL